MELLGFQDTHGQYLYINKEHISSVQLYHQSEDASLDIIEIVYNTGVLYIYGGLHETANYINNRRK